MTEQERFIEALKDYRKLLNNKHKDCESYQLIVKKLEQYKLMGQYDLIEWTKEYLAEYPPVFTAEELL